MIVRLGLIHCLNMRFWPFLYITASTLFAQDATFKADVRQVLVPVVVTDAKGRYVSGLHATDFRIFEDGVLQDIASLTTEAAASLDDIGALGKASNSQHPSGPRHTFVICIDALHSSTGSATQLREALHKLFDTEKPGDAQYVLAAIGRQLRILQPATTNPLAIEVKLRGAGFEGAIGGADGAAFSAELGNIRRRMDDFCRRCPCGARSKQQNCDSELDTLKQSVDAEAAQWRGPTDALMEQLRSVVDELAKLPTGRTLVLISGGFNIDPRREFYGVIASYLPNAPQFRLDDAGADSALQPIIQIASSRNVVIDSVDSRTGTVTSGVTGSMDASDSGSTGSGYSMIGTNRPAAGSTRAGPLQSAAQDRPSRAPIPESSALEQLAAATGGIHFHSGGDLSKELRMAIADGRAYYMIAYTPKNSKIDGGYRAIRVELGKGNLTVRAKPGYWTVQ